MKLFVDSSAWIGVADEDDQYHAAAAEFLKSLPPGAILHTSNYVVAETVTRLRQAAGTAVALRWHDQIRARDQVKIHYADEESDRETIRLFRKYSDHPLSFTDCSTAALMRRLGIDPVFAFDDDFRRIGFTMVPGD